MDAEQLAIVMRAREIDKDRERRLFAGLVVELRNLGLAWGDGKQRPWTLKQVLEEVPRETGSGLATNSMAAIDAAIAQADADREAAAREEADGWFEAVEPPGVCADDGGSLCGDDDDVEVTP